jgi:hypothetical protein
MFFAVVLTANHWIIDAAVGAIVSFAGLGVALVIERRIWPAVQARWERLAGHEQRPKERSGQGMGLSPGSEFEGSE